MNTVEHDNRSDHKVWLSNSEVTQLIETAEDSEQRMAFELGAKCGLRSHEVLQVAPRDAVETDAGWMLIVREGKGDKYRETPLPSDLAMRLETIDDMRDASDKESVLSVTSTRSIERWTEKARKRLAEETGDDRWLHLTFHDLRRTWATNLRSADADPLVVCEWGGWNDLETFLDHYQGVHSPEAQRREREKVEWL